MWSKAAQAMPSLEDDGQKFQAETSNRFVEQWQKNLKLMNSFSKTMSEPESTAAAINAINTLPEIILKMAKSGLWHIKKSEISLIALQCKTFKACRNIRNKTRHIPQSSVMFTE